MLTESDFVILQDDRVIVLDEEGYKLWIKYRWRYNLSVRHLHRNELVRMEGNRRIYRIVLFWVELLGFPKNKTVYYENRNRLDLRHKNLIMSHK